MVSLSYGIDRLRESMVKIIDAESERVAGSGFIIRSDGYLITCHHVIYELASFVIEYQEENYPAQYCQQLSNPDKDIAILKIELEEAIPVEIINPQKLESSIIVYGFPEARTEDHFPQGFDVAAESIYPSAPVDIRSTYRSTYSSSLELRYQNSWNTLPEEGATFLPYRINAHVDSGTSGGAVFSEELGGVVGVIQCSRSNESYVIRWDNILDYLERLGLEPDKNAVCQFLKNIEENFKDIRFFHTRNQEIKIELKEQYIPIQVTLERKYKHEVESIRSYAESEAELKRAYALKGMDEESKRTQVDWSEAKKEHQKIMVLADPGMGKSTLLRMEAGSIARQQREELKEIDEVIFPLLIRLSDLDKQTSEIIDAIPVIIQRNYRRIFKGIESFLQDKLEKGKCLLLLDALDEVPKENRLDLQKKLNRFARNYPCPIICTSRIVGYGGTFLETAKEVEIVPFTDKHTKEYIEIWFKNAAASIEDDSGSAQGLIEELRNKPQIQGLAQNPLLLSLLCSLYQTQGLTLPARRTEIYKQAVDYMLSQWRSDNQRLASEDSWVIAKTELLESLAYQFSCERNEIFSLWKLRDKIEQYLDSNSSSDFRNVTASALIRELSEEDGIIQKLSRDGDNYLFLHRTFQEYLTASYLQRVIDRNLQQGIALAKEHLWEYDWHETLSLLAGLLENPIPLLKEIIKEKDDIFKTLLLLAGLCITECQNNSPPLIGEIIDKIYRFWLCYPNASFIKSVLVALFEIDNPQAVTALRAALHDSDSKVRSLARYTLADIGNPQAAILILEKIGM